MTPGPAKEFSVYAQGTSWVTLGGEYCVGDGGGGYAF